MLQKLYFSPTGGTKKVVDLFSSVWNDEIREIDLSISDGDYGACSFPQEDLCVVGVPSFGGRVPAIACRHLQEMKAANTPTILIASYGNRDYDDTLLELKTLLEQSGFWVIAAIAAVTEHSMLHQFGRGRPNAEDANVLRGYGETIQRKLKSGVALSAIQVKGNTPYRVYNGLPLKPKAAHSCNNCGMCAKVCPGQAIPAENPAQTLAERCITCMRCVCVCPQHARKLNPVLLFAAGKKMEKDCGSPKENTLFF